MSSARKCCVGVCVCVLVSGCVKENQREKVYETLILLLPLCFCSSEAAGRKAAPLDIQ